MKIYIVIITITEIAITWLFTVITIFSRVSLQAVTSVVIYSILTGHSMNTGSRK